MTHQDPTVLYKDVHEAGGMTAYRYTDDPRHLVFFLARYKHTAKMLAGKRAVLEVGCGDGFGSRIVRQHVHHLMAIDADPNAIETAKSKHWSEKWPIRFKHDRLPASIPYEGFDAVYCLDVLEHINRGEEENKFLMALTDAADCAVIGTPSLESQAYASKLSKEGHVNCRTGADLHGRLSLYWKNVFLFSMHDETLGTSFAPMSQYHLALCVR